MILRRLGNKTKLAGVLQNYFPEHATYLEPFFGAGGMYFNKQKKANYNYLNDIDENVYNCFDVLLRYKAELTEYIELIPYHQSFWNECKTREPDNNIEKAVYFIALSNFGYMGKPGTLNFRNGNNKKLLMTNIDKTYKELTNTNNQFTCCDFRDFFDKISFRHKKDKENAFIYADPPYQNTTDNYSHSFKQNDFVDLLDVLISTNIKFAVSEFDNEFVVEESEKRGLNIIKIKERRTMKSRNTEILITNYELKNNLFDNKETENEKSEN